MHTFGKRNDAQHYYNFLLRFYAGGTKSRYIKKYKGKSFKKNKKTVQKGYKGTISKTNFFVSVNNSKASVAINKELSIKIQKKWGKNGK